MPLEALNRNKIRSVKKIKSTKWNSPQNAREKGKEIKMRREETDL